MPFDKPYIFKVDGRVVVIRNKGNKDEQFKSSLRETDGGLFGNGGKGKNAQFKVVFVDGKSDVIRLQSEANGKYVRIKKNAPGQSGKENIDIQGGLGPLTPFKVHTQDSPNTVKLESVKFPGCYLAVGGAGRVNIGTGGKWCTLKFLRDDGGAAKPSGPWTKAYEFKKDNLIIIRHKGKGGGGEYNQSLRVKPGDKDEADPEGGLGALAQLKVELLETDKEVKIYHESDKKRYLRIQGNVNKINFGGTGGALTNFKVHKLDKKGPRGGRLAKLESKKFPGKYVAVQPGNKIAIGNGGTWTELEFLRND